MSRRRFKEKEKPSGRLSRRRRRWRRVILGAALAVVALTVGWFAYQAAANLPGTAVPSLGNAHLRMATEPHVPHNSDPPTSGPHLPYLAPWGIHTQPISKELQVPNLEDGGVLVQYSCPTDCPELVAQLESIVRR